MEHDDGKIAESWWSGTGGRADAGPAAPPQENTAEWEALREKFVSTRQAPDPVETSHAMRVWKRRLMLTPIIGIVGVTALYYVLTSDGGVPAKVRNVVDALLTEQPVAVPATEDDSEAPQPASKKNRNSKRAARVPASSARPEGPAAATLHEESPFTIEVIDRNRRTIVHAYGDPLPLAVSGGSTSAAVVQEVPDLVIEETITPEGVASRTTNVGASVVLAGTVATDGRMRDVRVVRGPAEFVPAAIEAVRRWRFNVLQRDGIAVERPARVTVNMAIRTDGTLTPGLR